MTVSHVEFDKLGRNGAYPSILRDIRIIHYSSESALAEIVSASVQTSASFHWKRRFVPRLRADGKNTSLRPSQQFYKRAYTYTQWNPFSYANARVRCCYELLGMDLLRTREYPRYIIQWKFDLNLVRRRAFAANKLANKKELIKTRWRLFYRTPWASKSLKWILVVLHQEARLVIRQKPDITCHTIIHTHVCNWRREGGEHKEGVSARRVSEGFTNDASAETRNNITILKSIIDLSHGWVILRQHELIAKKEDNSKAGIFNSSWFPALHEELVPDKHDGRRIEYAHEALWNKQYSSDETTRFRKRAAHRNSKAWRFQMSVLPWRLSANYQCTGGVTF